MKVSAMALAANLMAWILFLGCARQDEVPPPVEVRFGEKTQCLSEASAALGLFAKGELSNEGLLEFWGCLNRAVDLFIRLTNPRSDSYTPRQIGNFLERFFLKDIKLSDSLLKEFMQVKRLILGGSVDRVTKRELQQTFEILKQFEAMTLTISPHMGVIERSFQSKGDQTLSLAQIILVEQAFDSVTQQLAQLLSRQGLEYPLMSLFRLFDEIAEIIGGPSRKGPRYEAYGRWINDLTQVTLRTSDRLQSSEWMVVQQLLSQMMGAWLKFQFAWRPADWRQGEALEASQQMVQALVNAVELSLSRREQKGFEFKEILALVNASEDLDLFQLSFDRELFEEIFNVINQRLLRSRIFARDFRSTTRFGRNELRVLKEQFMAWHKSQAAFTKERFENSSFGLIAPLKDLKSLSLETDWARLLDSPLPLKLTKDLRSDLSKNQRPWGLEGLTELNWQRAALRLLFRGYSREPLSVQDVDRSLQIEKMYEVAEELGPILSQLGFFSNLDRAFAQRVMMEGNLFLPRSNGNSEIEFVEALEYLSYFVSGFRTAQTIRDELKDPCRGDREGWLRRSCYRSQMARQKEKFYAHLPLLNDFFQGDPNWRQYQSSLESTVGQPLERDIDFAEILEISVLMQFVETFFLLFDKEAPSQEGFGRISASESFTAFRVYQSVLNDLLGPIFPLPGDDLAIFTFLLATGALPSAEGGGLGWEIRFMHWKHHPEQWDFQSTRLNVIKILETLAKERGSAIFN